MLLNEPVPPEATFTVVSAVPNSALLLLFRLMAPAFTFAELTASKLMLKWSVAFWTKVKFSVLAEVASPFTSSCAALPPAALMTLTLARPEITNPCAPRLVAAAFWVTVPPVVPSTVDVPLVRPKSKVLVGVVTLVVVGEPISGVVISVPTDLPI